MDIRKLLLDDFGVDFPISGGMGNSIENPIVLEKAGMNDYVGTEYAILKYLGIGRGVEWKKLRQEYFIQNDRHIDIIKIETIQTSEEEIITQIENYYFDFTECLKK